MQITHDNVDRDSADGIETLYGLDGLGDRIPVWERFSAPVQFGPGVHPAIYTIATRSISGVTRQGHGVNHPPHPVAKLNNE